VLLPDDLQSRVLSPVRKRRDLRITSDESSRNWLTGAGRRMRIFHAKMLLVPHAKCSTIGGAGDTLIGSDVVLRRRGRIAKNHGSGGGKARVQVRTAPTS
jgi:hypothetical protein